MKNVTAHQTDAFAWVCPNPKCRARHPCRYQDLGEHVTCGWCKTAVKIAALLYDDGTTLSPKTPTKETTP